MNSEVYHFELGDFKCMAVSDGNHTYAPPTFPPPATFLFVNAPGEHLEQVLLQHNLQPEAWLEWTSPYICLLVNTGNHLVLVDTGADGLGPDTGRLPQNLKSGNISPGDIDTVILTHGHPDHIGGNTDAEGRLAFPKARYVMWQDEWQFWMSEQAEQAYEGETREVLMASARKNLPPIQSQLDLIEYETEIVPGIKAVAAPGHTPGQMALSITSQDEQLLCLSDVVLHPIHMEQPQWCAAVDLNARQVLATRRKLLGRAVAEKALVLAFHFPFPGLGHVVQKGNAWQWQPVDKING